MKICEENPCDNLQSAICLHCQLVLCIPHIVDHGSRLVKEGDVISEDIHQLIQRLNIYFQDIERNYEEMMRNLNCWKDEQMKVIEEEFIQKSRMIRLKKDQLIDLDQQLSQRLIEQAVKPLDFIQQQNNTNKNTYQIIRQTIEDITRETTQLEKDLIVFKTITKTKKTSPTGVTKIPKRPLSAACKLLVELFADTSGRSDKFVKKFIMKNLNKVVHVNNFMTLFLSLLESSYSSKGINTKILYHYLNLIKKHVYGMKHQLTIIAACQVFVTSSKSPPKKPSETITNFLQFFYDNHCITKEAISNWSVKGISLGYPGYEQAKNYAQGFLSAFLNVST